MKVFKTTLLFQSRRPFPCFFSTESPSSLSSNNVCLPSLWWPFTVLPIISLLSTSAGSVCHSAGELVMPDSPPYCCIVIPHFCAFSYFTVALQKNSDTHEVSILSVIQAYTFSWAQLPPIIKNKQIFSNMGDEIWFSLCLRGGPSQGWEDEPYLCRGIHITMPVALPGILPDGYIKKTKLYWKILGRYVSSTTSHSHSSYAGCGSHALKVQIVCKLLKPHSHGLWTALFHWCGISVSLFFIFSTASLDINTYIQPWGFV